MSDVRQQGEHAPADLLAEGERTRQSLRTVEGTRAAVEGLRLVNDTILAQILFALWDCGFYEYSLANERFDEKVAAETLGLDAGILHWLLHHLAGRGLLEEQDGKLGLTARGRSLSHAMNRGTFDLYVGGYGALLGNLAGLLRGDLRPGCPELARSGRHVGQGSEELAAVRVVPAVSKLLPAHGRRYLLDLGCGTGGMLMQLARIDEDLRGVGVDMSADALAQARRNAEAWKLADRLQFVRAEIGRDALSIEEDTAANVDAVSAMYMLHEFGRDGHAGILKVLGEIRERFPGRLFIFTECLPPDTAEMSTNPPSTFSQLDYFTIHPLSGQGLPLPRDEWESLLEEAGIKLVDVKMLGWIGLYVGEL